MTFSKSGISTSVGVKGARITKRADGKIQKTISVPGTGVYHTNIVGSKKKKTPAKPSGSSAAYTPRPVVIDPPQPKYEFRSFYLENAKLANSDGQKRQDVLYLYKMKRPPFEDGATASLLSDPETPEIVQITLNGLIAGDAPKEDAVYICENWDRVDGVARLEVQGRRGEYQAYTAVRLRVSEPKPEPEPVPVDEPEPEPVQTREEQMRDYYDMGTKKQGCGCAIALGIVFLLLVIALML